jgi:hypothetical protein
MSNVRPHRNPILVLEAMNSTQFVSALVEHVHTPAINDTIDQLEAPSGRRPPKKVAQVANWYASLSEQNKANLKSVVELSVHGALFGLLCAIDGVRSIHENQDHEFQLVSFERGVGTRLNTLEGEFLHDAYQGLVYSPVFE